MAVTFGRLPASQRAQNIRSILGILAKGAIAIALLLGIGGFINFHNWQSNCVVSGGTLLTSQDCYYPAHTVFGGQRVPASVEYYRIPLLP